MNNPIIKGEPIYRDTNTNALVFTHNEQIENYKAKKKAIRDRDNQINTLQMEVNELKILVGKLLSDKGVV